MCCVPIAIHRSRRQDVSHSEPTVVHVCGCLCIHSDSCGSSSCYHSCACIALDPVCTLSLCLDVASNLTRLTRLSLSQRDQVAYARASQLEIDADDNERL
jgi:hypothetical protein